MPEPTSEAHPGTVLFSEEDGKGTTETLQGILMGPDEVEEGDEDDFIPEDEIGGYRVSRQANNRDVGGLGEEKEAEDDGHEESQDRNDMANEDEGDEAVPPPWLGGQRAIPAVAADRMSRALEPARVEGLEVDDQVLVIEDGLPSDGGPHSGSYHSGDSDEYQMAYRPMLERTEIKRDIRNFIEGVGHNFQETSTGLYTYNVVDRLGEGIVVLR